MQECVLENMVELDDKLVVLSEQIDRILAKKEISQPTIPNKTNNWNSVREAFKGQKKVDINHE